MSTGPALPEVALPEGYRMAVLGDADADAVRDVDGLAFAIDPSPEVRDALPYPLEPGRVIGVWAPEPGPDGTPTLAAVHGSYAFTTFGVPGGRLPTAGLTWVGVHPQHRRRGLARAMVEVHLRRSRERGEPLSALFAAEPAIYGRYGYGCAALSIRLAVPRRAALRDVPGTEGMRTTIERVDADRHGPVVGAVHDAVARPGWARRATAALAAQPLIDVPAWRDGAEGLRIAVVSDAAGEPRAYALFRRKPHVTVTGHPDGVVKVREAVALDAAAARVLWGSLTDLDLMATTEAELIPVDDALLGQLVDLRTVSLTPSDNVWVRLVDVPAALGGRRYAADVDVVLEVSDTLLTDNSGRWRLRGGPDGAEVTADDASPDLEIDVRELAAAFLGGIPLAALGAAGLVRERRRGALASASTAFGWPVAPVCGWIF